MHIPGQGFSRVRIKTDRDSRIRFADLRDLQSQFFKGGSQKGTAENYDCKISISVRYCVHGTTCSPSLPCVSRDCSSSLFPLRHIASDGHKMLRESRGYHRRLNLLTIFFHFRVTLTGIANETVQHATLCASFRVWPNLSYKLCTFLKYYGWVKIRV